MKDENPETTARQPTAKAQRREQEIFDAAAEVFDRKGYGAATLADIGEAVGMLKGSLYYYIGSKEDLLYHIIRTVHEGTLDTLEMAEAAGPDPADRLSALLHRHIAAFESAGTWIRVFYAEYSHLSADRRTEIQAVRGRYQTYVEQLITDGQTQGTFCPDHDARIIGNMLLTTVNGVSLWYRPGRDGSLSEVADAYTEFALTGLGCSPNHDHD